MGKLLVIIIILLIGQTTMAQSNFNNGFQAGYKEGYCYSQIGCIAPIPPTPPIPLNTENLNSYKDGYNSGFAMGLSDQKQSNKKERQQYHTATPENIDYMFKINPNDIEGLSKALYKVKGVTVGYLKNGNYLAAIKTAKNGLSVSPYDDEFMIFIGEGYRMLGDSKNAIQYYKRAYKRNGQAYLLDLINGLKEGRTDLPVLKY